jgi:hypothetical protein
MTVPIECDHGLEPRTNATTKARRHEKRNVVVLFAATEGTVNEDAMEFKWSLVVVHRTTSRSMPS